MVFPHSNGYFTKSSSVWLMDLVQVQQGSNGFRDREMTKVRIILPFL
jgi:hypothetical protein